MGAIDSWGAWECLLSSCTPMMDVPMAHRERWASGFITILRYVMTAQTEEQLDRGLKWLLIYPQATLRMAKRSGRKGQGQAMVASRFQAIMEGDWGRLLEMLSVDRLQEERNQVRRRRAARAQGLQEEDMEKKREVVLGLASRGQVGRAARRISSFGVASLEDPARGGTMYRFCPRIVVS